MAQERPSTPEKQLLDLIEDPKEQDLSQKKIKRGSFSLFSLSAVKGRFSFFLESIRSGSFYKESFLDIKGLNKVLKVCIVLLVLYLIVSIATSAKKLQEVPEFVTKDLRPSAGVFSMDSSGKKISSYLEGPRSRNIFDFGDYPVKVEVKVEDEIEEVAPPEEIKESDAKILSQKLGLVGIGWSDNPDVMVENTETKKMYFLKRGDRIGGLIKVEAIFQDKVILTYDGGKELELR